MCLFPGLWKLNQDYICSGEDQRETQELWYACFQLLLAGRAEQPAVSGASQALLSSDAQRTAHEPSGPQKHPVAAVAACDAASPGDCISFYLFYLTPIISLLGIQGIATVTQDMDGDML